MLLRSVVIKDGGDKLERDCLKRGKEVMSGSRTCVRFLLNRTVDLWSYILSRASEVGSPTNQTATARTFDPFLLRPGEPGTSQYIASIMLVTTI